MSILSTKAMFPLAARELRAVRVPALVACALASAIAFYVARSTPPMMRFDVVTSERARVAMHGVAFALGLVLAWFQVEDERRSDTWVSFLMLPVRRAVLVATKAGVGIGAIGLATGLPALGLALAVALPSATGGPISPVVFAAPLTVTLAGACGYFAAWIAALAPRTGRLGWIRLFALGSGALGALFTGASLLGGGLAVAVATVPALALGAIALRLAARPIGGGSEIDRVLVALAIAPVLAAMFAAGAAFTGIGDPPRTRASDAYHALDGRGEIVRVEREAGDRQRAIRLSDGAVFDVSSFETRTAELLSLSPLDRRTFGDRWSRVSYPRGALFYRGSTRELAYYRDPEGVLVGCLGPSGFSLPCAPLDGDLVDVVQSRAGAVWVVTTAAVWRLDAPDEPPVEVVRGEIRAGHGVAGDAAAVVVEIDGDVVAIARDGVSARCPLPSDHAPRTPTDGWSVMAAPTVDGPIAMLVDHTDGTRTARRCDVDGAVVADDLVPPEAHPPFAPRDGVLRAVAGPMLNLGALVLRTDLEVPRKESWIPAAIAAAMAIGVSLFLRWRSTRAIALAAILGFAVGPAYVVALVLAGMAGRARSLRAALPAFPDLSAAPTAVE